MSDKPTKGKSKSDKPNHRPIKWWNPVTGKPEPTKMRSLRLTEPAYKSLMARGGSEYLERKAGMILATEIEGNPKE